MRIQQCTRKTKGYRCQRPARVGFTRCEQCAEWNRRARSRRRVKDNATRRARNKQLISEAKKRPCVDCGIQYPTRVMQFDHVQGTKVFNICSRTAQNASKTVLEEEMSKCVVRCANCHALRH